MNVCVCVEQDGSSSDDDNLPLMELRRRLRSRDQSDRPEEKISDQPFNEVSDVTDSESDSVSLNEKQEIAMEIDMVAKPEIVLPEIVKPEVCSLPPSQGRRVSKRVGTGNTPDTRQLTKDLLATIQACL
jgi:hypothetical protein